MITLPSSQGRRKVYLQEKKNNLLHCGIPLGCKPCVEVTVWIHLSVQSPIFSLTPFYRWYIRKNSIQMLTAFERNIVRPPGTKYFPYKRAIYSFHWANITKFV